MAENCLTAPVQIITFPPLIVCYSPANFPAVETCADLIDGDGDLLLIHNGTRYKLIAVQQVERYVTAQRLEHEEARDAEVAEYDQRGAFGIQ